MLLLTLSFADNGCSVIFGYADLGTAASADVDAAAASPTTLKQHYFHE